MGEYIVELRQDGSVTLPPHVREILGLQPGDKMTLFMADEHIELAKLAMSAREAAEGMVEAAHRPHLVEPVH